MKAPRLTQEEKIYLGQMGGIGGESFLGRIWFLGQEELQTVARLSRKGVVELEPDEEGYYVVVRNEYRAWVEKKYPQFFKLHLENLRGKK